jgi:hypothetical protein
LKVPNGLDGDGQGSQVAGKVAAVEAGTTAVKTFVAVATTVLVLVVVDEDGQTAHVSELPLFPEKGVTVVEAEDSLLADTGVYGDEEVSSATGDVLEFPSQLTQDEDRAVCQSPQPPGPPCLSRLSTTPAKTELAKARRTSELFTILAT